MTAGELIDLETESEKTEVARVLIDCEHNGLARDYNLAISCLEEAVATIDPLCVTERGRKIRQLIQQALNENREIVKYLQRPVVIIVPDPGTPTAA